VKQGKLLEGLGEIFISWLGS